MKLPVRAWKETLTSLGFIRKPLRAGEKQRKPRRLTIENLEVRKLMTHNLYWDPASTLSTSGGGTSAWDTTTSNWYDPTAAGGAGADVPWTNGYDAVFPGTAGAVTVSGRDFGQLDHFFDHWLHRAGRRERLAKSGGGDSLGRQWPFRTTIASVLRRQRRIGAIRRRNTGAQRHRDVYRHHDNQQWHAGRRSR